MVCTAYYTELILQICNYMQKWCIVAKKKQVLDKSFYGYFCPRRKAANFCHPAPHMERTLGEKNPDMLWYIQTTVLMCRFRTWFQKKKKNLGGSLRKCLFWPFFALLFFIFYTIRIFLDQFAGNFCSKPKIKFSDRLYFFFISTNCSQDDDPPLKGNFDPNTAKRAN